MLGGSRGIGAAIAAQPAERGAAVALTCNPSPDAAGAVVQGITGAGGRAAGRSAASPPRTTRS